VCHMSGSRLAAGNPKFWVSGDAPRNDSLGHGWRDYVQLRLGHRAGEKPNGQKGRYRSAAVPQTKIRRQKWKALADGGYLMLSPIGATESGPGQRTGSNGCISTA
jgi:hypothetical protein